MVKTRRATDTHGNISSEMPVRASTSAADNIVSDSEISERKLPSRRYSDPMDETVRNVRRKESWGRELRNRVVNGSRSSTRIRDRPDRYRPSSTRSTLLRPRSAGHMDYLRRLGRNDEVDIVTEEDVGSDGGSDDDIFTPPVRSRRQCRTLSNSHISQPAVSFQRTTRHMSNGHSSAVLDAHESEGVRRSTRQRKLTYDNFNQSWILGTQTVRGYRMRDKDQTEEEEEEEEEDSEEVEPGEVEGGEERAEAQEGSDEEGEKPEVKKEDLQQEGDDTTEKENFEDMYSRVKRPRRKRQTILYTEERTTRSRSRKLAESSEEEAHTSDDGEQRPQSPRRHSKYHLRQRKPKVQHFQIEEPLRRAAISLLRSPVRRKRSRRTRFARSDSSGSSSDSEYERKKGRNRNRCLPVNFASAELATKVSRGGEPGIMPVAGSSLADTDPMELDPSVRFSHVGGLDEHIRCLKEMVVFPMLYPEVFERFHVQPPKGVLFHGPPGTGKTLLARALANECSQGTRRVAFFMRKGADCLSKWVGESERQLRLLFDQAYQMRPSIIFFDELDGLAPVRSCKQDQIHASIVSTLLALMDGLKNRGDVLLIGATNRIDAIDPALRRPGRFDRELFFPLPAVKERQDILQIHMSAWEQAPPPGLVSHLAEMASGYCGSDLRALCTEAVIQGLRRRYPQIYESTEKLMLDAGQVTVEKCDFQRARLGIVPAAHRVACAPARRLPPLVRPLMEEALNRVVNKLKLFFPHANLKSSFKCKLLPAPVPHPRLVLTGTEQQGHVAYVGPALLHHMEHVSVHSLELGALFGTPGTSPEEVCVQAFQEARRQLPSVLYIPAIESWWSLVPQTVQALLTSKLASLEPGTAVLLLASANCEFTDLPQEVQELFSEYRGEVLSMENSSKAEREDFLRPVLVTKPLLPPVTAHTNKTERLEPLPLAPPPEPPKLTESQEQQLYKKEEMTLRELRIFLREICAKLARNKQFFMFVQPVDMEEAPDYLDIIKEPMDLETIMSKIDRHEYACAADFLADVDLVCRNALEYNPDRSNQGKMIRHRACYLHDTAHALIKAEMDSDFEDQCKNISQNRKKRAFRANKLAPDFVYTAPVKENAQNVENGGAKEEQQLASTSKATNESASTSTVHDDEQKTEGSPRKTSVPVTPVSSADGKHKKRRSPWARGMLPRKRKRTLDEKEGTSPGTDGRQTPAEEEDAVLSASEEVNHKSSPDKQTALESDVSTPIVDDNDADLMDMEDALDTVGPAGSPAKNSQETDKNDKKVVVNQARLEAVLGHALTITDGLPLAPLLDLHAQLARIVHSHSGHLDRSTLPQELEDEVNRFAKLVCSQYK